MTPLGKPPPSGRRSSILLVAGIILAIAAAVFLVLAKRTPWHANSQAYFEGVAASYNSSKAFYENLHRYETNKWVYADIGYACAAWSSALLSLMALVNKRGWRVVTRTNSNPKVLIGVTLLSWALMLAGFWGNGGQLLGRQQVYEGSIGPMSAGLALITQAMFVGMLVYVAANFSSPDLEADIRRLLGSHQPRWPQRGRLAALCSLLSYPVVLPVDYQLRRTGRMGHVDGRRNCNLADFERPSFSRFNSTRERNPHARGITDPHRTLSGHHRYRLRVDVGHRCAVALAP